MRSLHYVPTVCPNQSPVSKLTQLRSSLGEDLANAEVATASLPMAAALVVDGASLVAPLEAVLRKHVVAMSKVCVCACVGVCIWGDACLKTNLPPGEL